MHADAGVRILCVAEMGECHVEQRWARDTQAGMGMCHV